MNCDCVFIIKEESERNDIERIKKAAEYINTYMASRSELTADCIMKSNIDADAFSLYPDDMDVVMTGENPKVGRLHQGDLFLIVSGKYHEMCGYLSDEAQQVPSLAGFMICFAPDGYKEGSFEEVESIPSNVQEFKTALFLTCSLEENIEHVNEWYDEIPEDKEELLKGIKDGPLVKPVSIVILNYPYDKETRLYFKEHQPATKHELFKSILEVLPDYLSTHPYSAPHDITDLVIETIYVQPFNDWYAEAFLSIGS